MFLSRSRLVMQDSIAIVAVFLNCGPKCGNPSGIQEDSLDIFRIPSTIIKILTFPSCSWGWISQKAEWLPGEHRQESCYRKPGHAQNSPKARTRLWIFEGARPFGSGREVERSNGNVADLNCERTPTQLYIVVINKSVRNTNNRCLVETFVCL